MGRKAAAERDKELVLLLQLEVVRAHGIETWLRACGVETWRRAVGDAINDYVAAPPRPARGSPPEVMEAYRETRWHARQVYQEEWLLRHVLDPASPECLLPRERARALRSRLLAKLRDRRRWASEPVQTVRVREETARQLDDIGRRYFRLASRSETVKAMTRIAVTNLLPPDPDQG